MQEFFEFGLAARVLYKAGLSRELGQVIETMGAQRAFFVTDKGVIAAGLLSPIIEGMGQITVAGVFDEAPPNSSVRVVAAGAEAALAAKADLIIAVGGGSAIDTAKGIRIVCSLGGSVADYEGYNVIADRIIPMVAIPTTAGTGSEVTNIAVILDEDEDRKISIVSRFITPDIAILDPELTCSLPPRLTAATGMDALSHAIETYVSTENNPFSDSLALTAIDLIANNLREAVHHGENMEARGQMLLAASMAGVACASSFFGVIHAFSHAVGGKFHVHHGTLNSLFLPPGMQFNSSVAPERYVRIARAMGVSADGRSDDELIAAGIAAVYQLGVDCGLPTRLREVGVPEEALPELAAISLVEPAIFNNPRVATEEELLEILQQIW